MRRSALKLIFRQENMTMLKFRHSTDQDVDTMVLIAEDAKLLLRERGISQWQRGNYPSREIFLSDIEKGIGFVVTDDDQVVAFCALTTEREAAYDDQLRGKWKTPDGTVYLTIHRGAVHRSAQGKGVATFLFESAKRYAASIDVHSVRADTHPDNIPMQKAFNKVGLEMIGEITLIEGDEVGDIRYAYEVLV